jgi:hypothetical protein
VIGDCAGERLELCWGEAPEWPERTSNSPRRMQFGEGARPRAPRRTCQNPVVYSRLRNVLGFDNNGSRGRDPSTTMGRYLNMRTKRLTRFSEGQTVSVGFAGLGRKACRPVLPKQVLRRVSKAQPTIWPQTIFLFAKPLRPFGSLAPAKFEPLAGAVTNHRSLLTAHL